MAKFKGETSARWLSYDSVVQDLAIKTCSADWRQPNWKPEFDEKLAIRHHKMTIALAMPQRKNHGL
jgi:hypothetical protein